MSFLPDGYTGSKLAEVNYVLGHTMFFAKNIFEKDKPVDNTSRRDTALEKLEAARLLPDYGIMTLALLNSIIEKAKDANWNDPASYEELFNFVSGIIHTDE